MVRRFIRIDLARLPWANRKTNCYYACRYAYFTECFSSDWNSLAQSGSEPFSRRRYCVEPNRRISRGRDYCRATCSHQSVLLRPPSWRGMHLSMSLCTFPWTTFDLLQMYSSLVHGTEPSDCGTLSRRPLSNSRTVFPSVFTTWTWSTTHSSSPWPAASSTYTISGRWTHLPKFGRVA